MMKLMKKKRDKTKTITELCMEKKLSASSYCAIKNRRKINDAIKVKNKMITLLRKIRN